MLKTTGLSDSVPIMLRVDNDKVVGVGGRVDKTVKNLFNSKKLKNRKFEILTYTNIRATKESTFLILGTKETFHYLR